MFLDWAVRALNEDDSIGGGFLAFGGFFLGVAFLALFACQAPSRLIWIIPLAILIGEWAFTSYVKKVKNEKFTKQDIGLYKFLFTIMAIPFAVISYVLLRHLNKVVELLLELITWLLSLDWLLIGKWLLIIICVIGAIALIIGLVIGYFHLNVMYVKKQGKLKGPPRKRKPNNKNKTKKVGGKKNVKKRNN